MAQFTGTYDSYDTRGAREDLADMIYRVTPSDTPLLSSIGRVEAKATNHEWQTHALAAVDTTNAHVEGDEQAFADPTATVRVGNRTQILKKSFLISDTLEAVDKAGRASEIAFNTVTKGLELKRDIETMLIGKNASSVTGNATTARISGSLSSWLTTNDNGTPGASPSNRGTSGGSTGFSSGNTVLATDGTQRAFTQAILDGVLAKMYVNSGMVEDAVIHAGVVQKPVLTNFDGIAGTVFNDAATKVIMATADIYASQYGRLKIVPNRYVRVAGADREVYIVRPSFLKLATLRPIQREELAKTGDATKFVIKTEACLQVDNEAAHGICADLT